MKILFIGDIVGKSGRDIVSSLLNCLKQQYEPDLIIANGENSAHGKGITYKIYRQLLNAGIDYITMGNHTYSKGEINDHMDIMDRLIVPYNHIRRTSNNFYKIIECCGMRFILTNILGSVLMGESSMEAPQAFLEVAKVGEKHQPDFYIVDLHAETTAEKRLFTEYFRDYCRAVIGTHTHVQTADEDILHGCAFISDVGMCGAYESIIGRDIEETIQAAIDKQKTKYTIADGPGMLCGVIIGRDVDETIRSSIDKEPTRYTIAEGDAIFCAVLIEIDNETKTPVSIERIQIRPEKNRD